MLSTTLKNIFCRCFLYRILLITISLFFFTNKLFSQENWRVIDLGTSVTLNNIGIWVDPADSSVQTFIAVGENGSIFRSTDQGVNWSQPSSNINYNLNDVFATSELNWVAIGDSASVIFSGDAGVTWTSRPPPDSVIFHGGAWFQDAGQDPTIVVYGEKATIYKTTDYGATWTKVTPLYPFDTYYSGFIHGLGANNKIINRNTSSSFFAWYFGGEGSFYKTFNSGDSWTYRDVNIGNILALFFTSADNGFLFGSEGQAATTAGGYSWSNMNTGTNEQLRTAGFNDESNGWAAGDNGTVVRTTDGGTSWSTEETGVDYNLTDLEIGANEEIYVTGEEGKIITNSEEQQTPKYVLTTIILPDSAETAGCNVTKNPDMSEYESGIVVGLQAIPANGWRFVEWSGAITGSNTNQSITMDSDKNVTAVFEILPPEKRSLTVNISPPEAAENGCSTIPEPGVHEYNLNSEINVHAIPNIEAGWNFKEWTGDASGSNLSAHLIMDDNKEVTANFVKVELTVSGSREKKLFCPEEINEDVLQLMLPVTFCANEIDGWNISKLNLQTTSTMYQNERVVNVAIQQQGGNVLYTGTLEASNHEIEATFDPPISIGPTECVTLYVYYEYNFENAISFYSPVFEYLIETKSVTAEPWEYDTGIISGKAEAQPLIVAKVITSKDEGFMEIQDAIESENTVDGDIINLCKCKFTRIVNINKEIKLKGSERESVISYPADSDAEGSIIVEADNVVIEDIRFTEDPDDFRANIPNSISVGTRILNGIQNALIQNNFFDKEARSVRLINSTKCIVSNNLFKTSHIGVVLKNSTNNQVINNRFNDYLEETAGIINIYLSQSRQNTINTNVSDGPFRIALYESNLNTINNNFVDENSYGKKKIDLIRSKFNTISNHNLFKITLESGSNSNNIKYNTDSSVEITDSKSNKIFENIFESIIFGVKITYTDLTSLNEGYNGIKENTFAKCIEPAISIYSSRGDIITGNKIYSNGTYSTKYSGIRIYNSDYIQINKNKIYRNGVSGIRAENSSRLDIFDNTITSHNTFSEGFGKFKGAGIYAVNSHDIDIIGNTIKNNCTGINLYNCEETTIGDNYINDSFCILTGINLIGSSPLITNNNIMNNSGSGIAASEGSNPLINYNNINGNSDFGILNENTDIQIDASNNYWGNFSGPSSTDLSGNIIAQTWLSEQIDLTIDFLNDTLFVVPNQVDSNYVLARNLTGFENMIGVKVTDGTELILGTTEFNQDISDSIGISAPIKILVSESENVIYKIKADVYLLADESASRSDSFYVAVYEPQLKNIFITPDSITIALTDSMWFFVSAADQYGNEVQNEVTWKSSNGNIDSTGFFIPSETGISRIIATEISSQLSDTVNIYVGEYPPELTSINISPQYTEVYPSDLVSFTYRGYNQYSFPYYFDAEWSTDGGEINNSGHFVAGESPGTYYVSITDSNNIVQGTAVVKILDPVNVNEKENLPIEYSLSQNYPNPFNPATNIRIAIPFESEVKLEIYNILGQRVKILSTQIESAGYKTYVWKPNYLASGVYFIRMTATSLNDSKHTFTDLKKMLYLK